MYDGTHERQPPLVVRGFEEELLSRFCGVGFEQVLPGFVVLPLGSEPFDEEESRLVPLGVRLVGFLRPVL